VWSQSFGVGCSSNINRTLTLQVERFFEFSVRERQRKIFFLFFSLGEVSFFFFHSL